MADKVGANAHSNTILIPHSPGALARLRDEISTAIGVGDLLAKER